MDFLGSFSGSNAIGFLFIGIAILALAVIALVIWCSRLSSRLRRLTDVLMSQSETGIQEIIHPVKMPHMPHDQEMRHIQPVQPVNASSVSTSKAAESTVEVDVDSRANIADDTDDATNNTISLTDADANALGDATDKGGYSGNATDAGDMENDKASAAYDEVDAISENNASNVNSAPSASNAPKANKSAIANVDAASTNAANADASAEQIKQLKRELAAAQKRQHMAEQQLAEERIAMQRQQEAAAQQYATMQQQAQSAFTAAEYQVERMHQPANTAANAQTGQARQAAQARQADTVQSGSQPGMVPGTAQPNFAVRQQVQQQLQHRTGSMGRNTVQPAASQQASVHPAVAAQSHPTMGAANAKAARSNGYYRVQEEDVYDFDDADSGFFEGYRENSSQPTKSFGRSTPQIPFGIDHDELKRREGYTQNAISGNFDVDSIDFSKVAGYRRPMQ